MEICAANSRNRHSSLCGNDGNFAAVMDFLQPWILCFIIRR